MHLLSIEINSGENDVGDVSPSPAATLTDEMRRASKDIHDTSDRLVNMKLGLVLTSPGLYGEALALFYPIFAKIEDIIELQKGHKQIGKIYPLLELMRRAPGFRKDMEYYLTSDRRAELDQMVQRGENSVMEDFLQHLDRISKEDPVLILAYIYHEYAGILAGGQIIKRIVQKALGLSKDSDDGVQCFCMSDKTIAPKIVMSRMKRILNEDIAITEEQHQRIVDEGVEVFRRNNALVNTIHTTNAWADASRACLKRVAIPLVGITVFIGAYMYTAWFTFVHYEFVHANEFDHEGP